MLAKIFGKSSFLNLGYVLGFLVVYYGYVMFFEHKARFATQDFLDKLFLIFLSLSLLITNYFAPRKYFLVAKNDYHILVLTILMIAFDNSLLSWKVLVSNLCLMVTFQKIYRLSSSSDARQILFDASFFLGLASLFSFWSCLFLLCVYASIFFVKLLNVKTIIIILLGFCSPIFLYLSYEFVFGNNDSFWHHFNFLEFKEFEVNFYSTKLYSYVFFLLLLALSMIFSLKKNTKVSFIAFKTLRLLVVHVLVSIAIFIFQSKQQGAQILFVLLPASIFISNQLSIIEQKYRNIAITSIICGFLITNFIQTLA